MPDNNVERMTQQARALVGQGKLDEAIGYYREALQMDPYNTDAYREMGNVFEKRGDLIKAVDAYLMGGQVLLSRGQFDEALKIYNQIISIENSLSKKPMLVANVDQVKSHLINKRGDIAAGVGNIYLQKGATDEAIKILKGSLEVASSHPGVHTMLGVAYMQKGMDKEAFGEFQEVVRLAPNEAAFAYERIGEIFVRGNKPPQATIVWFRNAGDLYAKHEQLHDAARAFENILGFDPKHKEVLHKLGDIYNQLGMKDQAFNIYKQLAQVFSDEGMPDKVISLYEKLVELNPDDPQSLERLIEVYRSILQRNPANLGVRQKLVKHLLKRGQISEALPEYLQLAQSYLEKGLYDESLQATQKTLELDPRNQKAREILAEVYLNKGDRDAALSEYTSVWKLLKESGDESQAAEFNEKLKTIFPEQAELRYQSCLTYRDQGNLPQALAEIQAVLRDRPDDIEALLIEGDLLSQLSRWEEAVTVFNRVLALDPSRPDIRRRLTDYYFSIGKLDAASAEIKALTEALQSQGRFLEAELLFRKLLAYYPDSVEIRSHILGLKVAQQDKEKAVRECVLLANLFLQQGQVEHALATLEKILEFDPENLNARHRMARLARTHNVVDKALQQYQYLASYYSSRNLPKQALKCLEEILALAPDNIEHRQMLIEMLVKQVRLEEATEQYKLLLRRYIQDGRSEDAERCVQEILELQPLHSDLRLQLGEIYLESHQLQEGLALMHDLVQVYLQKKQHTRVMTVYQRIAEVLAQEGQWNEHWSIREKMAELSVQEGKMDRAIAEYLDILEGLLRADQLEQAASAYQRLSHFYVKEDLVQSGVKTLESLVERFNGEGLSRQANFLQDRIVDLLERQGTLEAALSMLTEAAERYEEADQVEEAIGSRKRAVELLIKQDQTEAAMREYFRMIEFLLKHDQPDQAHSLFEEAVPHVTNLAAQQIRFADLLFNHHYYEKALPLYVSAHEAEQEDPRILARIGLLYAIQGHLEGFTQYAHRLFASGELGWLVDTYKQATHYNDQDGEAHLRLGQFYHALGFEEEAVREFNKAARHEKTMLPAYRAMAWSFKEQGMLDLAIRTFLRLLDKFPEDETLDLRYDLGDLYKEAGRLDEALATFQDVYATDISYRDVTRRIAEVEGLLAEQSTRV